MNQRAFTLMELMIVITALVAKQTENIN